MTVCYDVILEYVNNKKVLDIGSCANQGSKNKSKTLFNEIKKRARIVVGVDIEGDGVEIIQGNAEVISLKETFDIVIAGDVIEHLHNPGLFLDNMHRHLEKDGLIIVVTPNVRSIGHLLTKLNKYHTCWYCQGTLKYLVEQHNFKVERMIFGLRRRTNMVKDMAKYLIANHLCFICRKV